MRQAIWLEITGKFIPKLRFLINSIDALDCVLEMSNDKVISVAIMKFVEESTETLVIILEYYH